MVGRLDSGVVGKIILIYIIYYILNIFSAW